MRTMKQATTLAILALASTTAAWAGETIEVEGRESYRLTPSKWADDPDAAEAIVRDGAWAKSLRRCIDLGGTPLNETLGSRLLPFAECTPSQSVLSGRPEIECLACIVIDCRIPTSAEAAAQRSRPAPVDPASSLSEIPEVHPPSSAFAAKGFY